LNVSNNGETMYHAPGLRLVTIKRKKELKDCGRSKAGKKKTNNLYTILQDWHSVLTDAVYHNWSKCFLSGSSLCLFVLKYVYYYSGLVTDYCCRAITSRNIFSSRVADTTRSIRYPHWIHCSYAPYSSRSGIIFPPHLGQILSLRAISLPAKYLVFSPPVLNYITMYLL
jgi:hypothetical protein